MSDQLRSETLSRHFFRTSADARAGRLNDAARIPYLSQVIHEVKPTGGILRRWKVVARELPPTTPPPPVWPS